MPSKTLNIGMVGYGFMGRAHSNAYKRLNDFFPVEHRPVLKAACARNREKVQAFAENWGYERVETDWRKLVEADDIDLIDIGAPNHVHKEIALAAAAAGTRVRAASTRNASRPRRASSASVRARDAKSDDTMIPPTRTTSNAAKAPTNAFRRRANRPRT